jgi:PAS domain S-box-containing protein
MRHRDEIIALILARYNTQGLDRDMLAFEAGRTEQLMQPQLVEIGYMNPGRWQHIADIYAELEMQPKGRLPEDFLYRAAQQQLPAWLTPTAIFAALTILTLSVLVRRNIRLSRQLRREIAAQEEAHRQLAKSEEHSRFMLENSADTFWELDPQFRFTYVSEADHRIRGFEASEVIGQSLFSMLTPASLANVREGISIRKHAEQQGKVTGPMRFEFEIYCKDGSTVWAESNSMPLRDPAGNIIGFQGVTRDVEAVEKPHFKPQSFLRMARSTSRHSSFHRLSFRRAVSPAPTFSSRAPRRAFAGASCLLFPTVQPRGAPTSRCYAPGRRASTANPPSSARVA